MQAPWILSIAVTRGRGVRARQTNLRRPTGWYHSRDLHVLRVIQPVRAGRRSQSLVPVKSYGPEARRSGGRSHGCDGNECTADRIMEARRGLLVRGTVQGEAGSANGASGSRLREVQRSSVRWRRRSGLRTPTRADTPERHLTPSTSSSALLWISGSGLAKPSPASSR